MTPEQQPLDGSFPTTRLRRLRYHPAVRRLVGQLTNHGLPYGTFLNVNIPDQDLHDISGIVYSRQGVQRFEESVEKRTDPRFRPYYWQGPDRQTFEDSPDVDGTALKETYISITPIKCDTTDYDVLNSMQDWNVELPGTVEE